ncbi:hypothetical protein M427DRAFT_36296 [Gonapodya prolifera JEL478]|uniref:Uncharacterized protein n=1 Tax=Gonapodya prolifera (strain JEL478) TaxID=1344416 RepID=A0A139A361_GONPJ|nr:hypothetical protein M427DRAFT_36296 [Gonapodya prolifera JEL478]|eukprot:KXS11109.1 hypothetical protein M427DRAFT_36296 [Gonapodya prolifera JEL478]
MPKNVPQIFGPTVYPDEIVQPMYMGLYDTRGVQVGTSYFSFSVQIFSSMLDSVKGSATPNSLFYVVSSQGEVLAISGLGNSTMQSKILKKAIDPTRGVFALNTIFDYDASSFPLLNLSASAILAYSGGNLSTPFADRTWQTGDYLVTVTTKVVWSYRYIVVTAAPLQDYLGDTINLAANLKADGVRSMIQDIVSAIAVVVFMSFSAVTFVLFFIEKPMRDVLSTMKKATKLGNWKARFSIVSEIHGLQNTFKEMVIVFADALKSPPDQEFSYRRDIWA